MTYTYIRLTNRLLEIANEYIPLMYVNKYNQVGTANEFADFYAATTCGLCGGSLTETDKKVFHHSHWDSSLLEKESSYICAAHNSCNLQAKHPLSIPVFFHGLSNFDSHLIVQGISKSNAKKVTCLAKSSEKFLCLTIDNKLKILDSYSHMPASLATLANNLSKGGLENFPTTSSVFAEYSDIMPDLLKKLAFPYELITFKNLDTEIDDFPPIENFYCSLKEESCSEEEYARACRIFRRFECRSLKQFLGVYNLLDCTLLADILIHHRKAATMHFNIDPFRFVSSPSFVFFAALSKAAVNLEYVRDVRIHQMIKDSIRGGIVNVPCRYAKANLPKQVDFDSTQPQKHLIFLDFTGLYSFCMQFPLPIGGYKFLNDQEVATFDFKLVDDSKGVGYYVKCDIEIPVELHDKFKDLPPFAEKLIVSHENLSTYQKMLLNDKNELRIIC